MEKINPIKRLIISQNKILPICINLLLFFLLMYYSNIPLNKLLILLTFLIFQICCGFVITRPLDMLLKTYTFKILVSMICGISISGCLFFLLGHKAVYTRLFIYRFEYTVYIILGIHLIIVMLNLKYLKRRIVEIRDAFIKIDPCIPILITASIFLAFFITTNYSTGQINTFGWTFDHVIHLEEIPKIIIETNGFPIDGKFNVGLQSILSVYAFILGSGKLYVTNFIKANSFFGTFSLILFVLLIYSYCKDIYGLKRYNSLVATLITLLFGAINWPLFYLLRSPDGRFMTSYLGFLNSISSIYHNLTQQYTMLFILASFMLVLLFITRYNNSGILLIYSSIFAVISYIVKPSGYVFLGPIIFIISIFSLVRLRKKIFIIPLIIIILPIFYQLFYFSYLDAYFQPSEVQFGLLKFYKYYFDYKYPFLKNSYFIFIIILIFRSFGGLIIPTIFSKYDIDKKIMLINNIVFVFTMLVSVFLVESGNRLPHGNFSWIFSAFFILYIPYILKLTFDIHNKILRYLSFSIIGLHVIGGLLHLTAISIQGSPA